MVAHKLSTTITEDHRLDIQLPADFPGGPVEVIILAASAREPRLLKLENVLQSGEASPGDPVAEALRELREERARHFDEWPG